jgi:hypothetical protein
MTFPADLPDVPDPANNTLIDTGKIIPVTGIWELRNFSASRLWTRPLRPLHRKWPINDCPAGARAPVA